MTTSEPISISSKADSIRRPSDGLLWINADARITGADFGWKAAHLCCAEEIVQRTPPGFAISKDVVDRIVHQNGSNGDLDDLRAFYLRLTAQTRDRSVVVRSSSCVEDSAGHSFAGLFQTVQDVRSFDDLISAIRSCYRSAECRQIQLYAKMRGVSIPAKHLALLIQSQVEIQHSALIQISRNGYLFEAYEGGLCDRIRGFGAPEHVVMTRQGRSEIIRASKRLPEEFLNELGIITRDVERIVGDVGLSSEAILEVATNGQCLYLLQVDIVGKSHAIVPRRTTLGINLRKTPLATDSAKLGLKGAAMKYFRESGLFASPMCILTEACEKSEIANAIADALPLGENYTARFSHSSDLGLPRSFLRNRSEIAEWICATRKKGWAAIAHTHIDVRHSFELLLTQAVSLLEHIPGMWESDNTLDPDVLLFDDQQVCAWKCTHQRSARFAHPGAWSEAMIQPSELHDFHSWADRLLPIIGRLRRDFQAILPLNFHFVEDSEGRWYFLNIRRGFELDIPAVTQRQPHIVSEASDLEQWDGQSPILIRFPTPRGAERQILAIAERLPKRNRYPILVDFGLLSHPAMILRELGFQLVPSYLYFGTRLVSPSYERLDWCLDQGSDPIARICKESFFYADSCIRVVADRDPIVPGHLLLLAEAQIRGLADGGYEETFKPLLEGQIPGVPKHWIFVERGRASFCTSGFTDSHAHAHILPAVGIKNGAFDEFVSRVGAERQESLEKAFENAHGVDGEYYLLANSNGEVYLRTSPPKHTLEKRLIRTFFAAQAL